MLKNWNASWYRRRDRICVDLVGPPLVMTFIVSKEVNARTVMMTVINKVEGDSSGQLIYLKFWNRLDPSRAAA